MKMLMNAQSRAQAPQTPRSASAGVLHLPFVFSEQAEQMDEAKGVQSGNKFYYIVENDAYIRRMNVGNHHSRSA